MVKRIILGLWCSFLFPLMPAFADARKDIWQTTDLVWNFGIAQVCDKGLNARPVQYFEKEPIFDGNRYNSIQKGDILWVQCRFLPEFCQQVLKNICEPFVLVISDGDETFPANSGLTEWELENFLQNPYLVHLFAQNCAYSGPSTKVSSIPIGIDFHTIAYKSAKGGWGEVGTPSEQELALKQILAKSRPTRNRIVKAFVDFQHSDSMHGSFNRYLECGEDRKTIFQRLVATGLLDFGKVLRRTQLWKKKAEYAFSISPHGNGLDCHRTWEDLALGCIVIVKTSPLDVLYEGLPVVIVKDWSEVTRENLVKWLELYGDASENPVYRQKLTNAHWIQKIQDMAQGCK